MRIRVCLKKVNGVRGMLISSFNKGPIGSTIFGLELLYANMFVVRYRDCYIGLVIMILLIGVKLIFVPLYVRFS